MKPDLFVSGDEYRARMDKLVERTHANPPAEGFSEVLVAGEPEARLEAERRRTGIPYGPKEFAALQEEAAKAGQTLGRQVLILKVTDEREFPATFATMVQQSAGGLLIGSGPYFLS